MKKALMYMTLSVFTAIIFLLLIVILNSHGYIKIHSKDHDTEASTAIKLMLLLDKSSTDDVHLLIDINEKLLYVVSKDHILAKYPVATGKPDTPSPVGDFLIIQKARWGEGFGSAWLGLNVPWGTYGIHGTKFPGSIGRAASHGCIRMKNQDVDKLYNLVKVGTPVKIMGGHYGLLGNSYRILAPGDRGGDVMLVQDKLNELGFYKGSIDGIYGTGLERALNNYQKSKNLPLTNRINEKLYKELGITLME